VWYAAVLQHGLMAAAYKLAQHCQQMILTLLDIVLPDTCVICRETVRTQQAHRLCDPCWMALPHNHCACPRCGLPLPSPGICGTCLRQPAQTHLHLCALVHRDSARWLVHQLKYAHNLRAAAPLAMAMATLVRLRYATQPLPQQLVVVPLSYRRGVQRGHNQATALARYLSRSLRIPLLHGATSRTHRIPQHRLRRGARLALAPQHFRVRRRVAGQHLALVDDVCTTGATTGALATALRRAGANRVDIWCATRATLP